MSCIIPKKIDLLLDETQFDAKMQQYGVTKDSITESHPFITDYLQPLLEEIAVNIAHESGRTEDWQQSPVSVILFDPHNPKKTFSSHDHKTNEIIICWDTQRGSLREQCKQLASDIRHESEHANQTDGDGYSIDQRTLSQLSRISYHPGNNDLYYNNFNEIRARLAEFKMHQAIYEQLVKQNAPFEQRQQAAQNLASAESHLTHHLSQDAQERWMACAQKEIKSINGIFHKNAAKQLRAIFPEATSLAEAKEMALTFLQQKAPDIFKDLRDEIKAHSDRTNVSMLQIDNERKLEKKKQAQKDVMAHEKAGEIPLLTQMPQPLPNYRFLFTDPSQVDIIMDGNTITLYNRALVQEKGELYLIGDTSDIYRAYAHPRPPELTPKSSPENDSHSHDTTELDVSAKHHHEIDDLEELDWDTL